MARYLRVECLSRPLVVLGTIFLLSGLVIAQRSAAASPTETGSDFGPVMRAYLGYLNNEQEVVDDRASRREISASYYRRNLSRIRALKQTAIRLVRQSGNDYVPELEAVTVDEFGTLFEKPPKPTSFRVNEIVDNKLKFLASVRYGEVFYVFARLDPYEQAELIQRAGKDVVRSAADPGGGSSSGVGQTTVRPRRAVPR